VSLVVMVVWVFLIWYQSREGRVICLFYQTSGIRVALWKAVAMAIRVTPPVLEAAKFAVDEYNKKQRASLKLDDVVFGVEYTKIFYLILKCNDGKSTGFYAAIVSNIFKKYLVIFKSIEKWIHVKYIETQMDQLHVLAVDAVNEYSKQQKRSIKFRRVVAAQQLDGVDYRLIIVCEDGNYIRLYEVIEKRLKEFESLDLYNKQQVIDALQGTDDAEELKMQSNHVGIDSVTLY